MELNPLLTPRHPALAAVTSHRCATQPLSCSHSTLQIISLLHCHGRSVFQQRVLSPPSSSIRPARGLSAAQCLCQRLHRHVRRICCSAPGACDSLARTPSTWHLGQIGISLVLPPAIARAPVSLLYPVQIRLHRLLDSTRRGSTGRLRADASDYTLERLTGVAGAVRCASATLTIDWRAVHRATYVTTRTSAPAGWVWLVVRYLNSRPRFDVWIGH